MINRQINNGGRLITGFFTAQPLLFRCGNKNHLLTTVIFSLQVGLIVTLFSAAAYAVTEIDTVQVERSVLPETVRLDGVVEATQQSTVSAQTTGRIMELPYDVDDWVAADELIVRLEDSEQRARRDQAQAGLEEAKASLQDARQRFSRMKSLREKNLASQQDFDQAQNTLNSTQARVGRAEASLAEAREQLEYTRVRSPYSGILTARHVEIGESVSPGQPLLSGLSLELLRVVVDLPQRYAERVRTERQALVSLASGRSLTTGEVTIYPYANPQTHTFRLRLILTEPGDDVYPGMLVKVEVPVGHREALWLPSESVFHHSELTAVFVVNAEGIPRLRQIRTGVERGDRIEVLAGLDAGERVAARPGELFGSERLTIDNRGGVEE